MSVMPVKKVHLFTTCLVDQVFPQVGVAVVRLLRRAGLEVVYPEGQVCCGQPFFNSGFHKEARSLAKQTIALLREAEAVVIPSGSCTAMIRQEYPKLFSDDPKLYSEAQELAGKTFEFTESFSAYPTVFEHNGRSDLGTVTYHDSCHMCRNLGVRDQPRQLLKAVGYRILEMEESERCCGFGGLFYARMPEISQAMAAKKMKNAQTSGAPLVVTADPGCLMRMQQERGGSLNTRHIAELLEEAL